MAAQNHNILHYLLTVLYFIVTKLVTSIVWIGIAMVGILILLSGKEPWVILAGLPLALIGGGLLVNYLSSIFFVIFDLTYNRGVCPICNPKSED